MTAADHNQMTLGELIACMEQLSEDVVVVGLGCPHSYRGYYEDLAFDPEAQTWNPYSNDGERTFEFQEMGSVRSCLSVLRSCIGREFQGYKGGYYKMTESTDLWIAQVGSSGVQVVGLVLDQRGVSPLVAREISQLNVVQASMAGGL